MMKSKCLGCKNYYAPWRFCAIIEISGNHLFRLNTRGKENEMLECNDYEPKEEKEEELQCLHDYIVDDLSIEYHSSKKLYEDIKSLRRWHGLDEETKKG